MRSYFCFNRILAGVIALLLMATIFFACTKTSSDAAPSNANDNLSIAAAADQASVSGIYDDLFSIAAEISESEGLSETGRKSGKVDLTDKLGQCYTAETDDVTLDHWPKTVTVSFGTGCADASGRTRAGVVKFIFTGYFRYPGATITVQPVTYTVNGVSVSGTKVITNVGTNDAYKYTTQVKNGSIKLDTVVITYGSNITITQTAGAGTTDVADDIYTFSGSDTLTYPSGNVAITAVSDSSALERKFDCAWIGKGKAVLTLKSVQATIDYGNGVCDDSATISIGDKVKTIGLPK
ncbi:hypothetical protein SAMN05428988_1742 [Chitinophaga sp. YR573]|uniref:hypothetical protein n=1 Tax=Chitinophaga sp. YR573 TaxID=1881040 RepID=UPI0008B6C410|nr:hypothetical protein [Chitinophaga sp. YR573]SEW06817.1 hypothetical protein SAMN05428988_1742 [Chitinophaga sp. YR573]